MPKELIYEPSGLAYPDQPDRIGGAVDVRWDRESGYFQIGTHDPQCEVAYPQDPIPAAYGWWVTLDRGGINDLIRVLRRARDQAFGRDE